MYETGNISLFWQDHHKHVNYSRKSKRDLADEGYWRSLGFSQEFFTGEMYIVEQTKNCWTENFFNVFQGKNFGLTLYKMGPGVLVPTHIDKFAVYKKLFNIKNHQKISRAVIFLEGWATGHFFQIENKLFSSWSRRDYVLWDKHTPHMAANLGTTDRYTAQITFTDI